MRSRDRSPNGLDWGSPFHVQGATIMFTRSSDLAKLSSCTGVSEARLDLFAHKQRAYDSIPPTSGALKEHVKRAHSKQATYGTSLLFAIHTYPVQEIGDGRKLMVHEYPTGQSWQLSPNRVKN